MRAAVIRLTQPNSIYRQEAQTTNEYSLHGVVKALGADYTAGYTRTFRQLCNADLMSGFLSMAEYLLQSEELKQPAAVMAGWVLEEHLRKLCEQNGVPTTDAGSGKAKRADTLNSELAKAEVYGKNDQK